MTGIHDNIRARRPSLVDWEVIHMIVTIMKRIVGIIVLNQCSGKEWLLSEAIVDLVRIYNYCSGGDVDDVKNTLIQWWKREATCQMHRTCAVTYLRYIPR